MVECGPVKVNKSKSNSSQPACAYLASNEISFFIRNNTSKDVIINYVDVEFIAGVDNNTLSSVSFMVNGIVVGTPQNPFPVTVSSSQYLDVHCTAQYDFEVSHMNETTVDFMFTYGFTEETVYQEAEQVIGKDLCPNVTIYPAYQPVNGENDCELQYVNSLTFEFQNELDEVVTITEIEAYFEDNPNNGIQEITLYDGNGEEEISLPYELMPLDGEEQNVESKIIVEIQLENDLGYPYLQEVQNITFDYIHFVEDSEFSDTKTFTYNFKNCNEMRRSNLQIFPNPVQENSIVNFDVKIPNSIVSAYLVPKTNLSNRIVTLLQREPFQKGNYQIDLDAYKLKSGLYEVVIDINGYRSTKSISKMDSY